MPELNFQVEGAAPERFAAVPMLVFKLRVSEAVAPGAGPTSIHAVVLRCQIRIEPSRRSYSAPERERLPALFGTPERGGQTRRPMLWTHVGVTLPPFAGATVADLPVP